MMRVYITFFSILFLISSALTAQVTLNNSYFPAAGDTLSTIIVVPQPGEITVSESGNNQLWDFSQVSGGVTNDVVYRDFFSTDTLDAFPTANLVITGSDGVTYIKSTEDEFQILGFEGIDPAGFGINLVSKFSPPLNERAAPLDFLDFDTYNSSSDVAFGADVLPSQLFDSLPFAPDSLRVRVNIDRVDLVDAWGTVILPGNNAYETLRQKRVQLSESRLEVKVPIIDWVDVTDQFAGGPGGGGFLGMDTMVSYSYYAQGVKEPIVVLTMDAEEENVVTFSYKAIDGQSVSTQQEIKAGYENVYAYPNPAINFAKFNCVNLRPDYYELKIFNILGLEAFRQRHFISGSKVLDIDLSRFRKGTYMYSLTDTSGKVLVTKRLVVIKP